MQEQYSLSLNFGFLYYPQIDSIRDYFPYWIEPRWTRESTLLDLMIARSLGARHIRFHILPANYSRDHYPGAEAEMYKDLIPFALLKAREFGLSTHVDIHTDDFESLQIEDIAERLEEFGMENIGVLQIINEHFYLWKHKKNIDKIEEIFSEVRGLGFKGELCFDAGGTVRRKIAATHPMLARTWNRVMPVHYYTPNLSWDEYGENLLLDLLTGGRRVPSMNISPEQHKYYEEMISEEYSGLTNEMHITEVQMASSHVWSHFAPAPRAEKWPELMQKIASETDVSTVCNTTFKDKISWREYGYTQSGVLLSCMLPRPEAEIFRKTAMNFIPETDIYSDFELQVSSLGDGVYLTATNKTEETRKGEIAIRGGGRFSVELKPKENTLIPLESAPVSFGSSRIRHYFAEFKPEERKGKSGACFAWKATAKTGARDLAISSRFKISGVDYPDGISSIEEFLHANFKRLAIVVEPPAGPEAELAVRLQSVIAESWGVLPMIASLMTGANPILKNRAVIIIGCRGSNSLLRCAESLVGERYMPIAGAGVVISAHQRLFQRSISNIFSNEKRPSLSVGDVIFNPGAMLVVGKSFDSLRAGVYDLIQRILPPGDDAQLYNDFNRPECYSGIAFEIPRNFGVYLPEGGYRIQIACGSNYLDEETSTVISLEDEESLIETKHGIKWFNTVIDHKGGLLKTSFSPSDGKRACPAAFIVHGRDNNSQVFACYFHRKIRVDMDYEGYQMVSLDTKIGAGVKSNDWTDVRSEENEFLTENRLFGWMD